MLTFLCPLTSFHQKSRSQSMHRSRLFFKFSDEPDRFSSLLQFHPSTISRLQVDEWPTLVFKCVASSRLYQLRQNEGLSTTRSGPISLETGVTRERHPSLFSCIYALLGDALRTFVDECHQISSVAAPIKIRLVRFLGPILQVNSEYFVVDIRFRRS